MTATRTTSATCEKHVERTPCEVSILQYEITVKCMKRTDVQGCPDCLLIASAESICTNGIDWKDWKLEQEQMKVYSQQDVDLNRIHWGKCFQLNIPF